MLTLVGGQVESLWDEVLPVEVRELPEDLARLDRVLSDELLLFPIAQAWEREVREEQGPPVGLDRTTFVRLMKSSSSRPVGSTGGGPGGV